MSAIAPPTPRQATGLQTAPPGPRQRAAGCSWSDGEHAASNLAGRCASAVRRRVARAWRSFGGERQPSLGGAIDRLCALAAAPQAHQQPAELAEALSTLAQYGEWPAARQAARRLLACQRANGAFAAPQQLHGAVLTTERCVRGLLGIEPAIRHGIRTRHQPSGDRELIEAIETSARRTAGFLMHVLATDPPGAERNARDGYTAWLSPAEQLAGVSALLAVMRRWPGTGDEATAWQILAGVRRRLDLSAPLPAAILASTVEALLSISAGRGGDLGHSCRQWAEQTMRRLAVLQARGGSVPAWTSCRGRCAPAPPAVLAHLAALWFRLGDSAPARAAMGHLRRRSSDYAFANLGSIERFLHASQAEVEAAFDTGHAFLPRQIQFSDGRMNAVREWFARMKAGALVADVGCGPGRFLSRLSGEYPSARFVGIDPCRHLLDALPAGIEGRAGSMLNLPAADAEFDAAMAVESLEHALHPRRAVAELCRVVRPGGWVLIIDKDLARQPLSLHQPWEQWFTAAEVSRWLQPYCSHVEVHKLADPAGKKNPLFLAWQGRVADSSSA